MKRITTILFALAAFLVCSAQKSVGIDSTADEVVVRWNNATAPHSNHETKDETVNARGHFAHTSETVFYIFKADPAKATGQAVVVLPGGGYSKVCIRHEGFATAEWFRKNGITALVAKYRLPNRGYPEASMDDAEEAIRFLRANAERLHINPAKVGICGASAGGHLAASVSNLMPDDEKPAFTILFYPRISGSTWTRLTYQTTYFELLGADRTPAEVEKWSCHNMVTEKTPPTMLLLSDDDPQVDPSQNSTAYYLRLKHFGVKASMHIFPSGIHGWAGHKNFKYLKDYEPLILDFINNLE